MKTLFSQLHSFLNYFVGHFGFDNAADFFNSLIHSKLLLITVPMSAAVYAFVEQWFGFSAAIFISFVVMATVELVTGLWGAKAKGIKIESRKFGRFGLKLLVWLSLIMVANSFATSYADLEGFQNGLIYQIFSWLHGVLLVYISFEYLISILENLGKITGKSQNRLIAFLNKKMDGFFGVADEQTKGVEEKPVEVPEKPVDEEKL